MRVQNTCPSGRRGQRGATALEFGLVAPVVFLLLFGIVQYGYWFWSAETAAATAREAARRLAVGTDWSCTRDEIVAAVRIPAIGDSVSVPLPEYADDSGVPVSPRVGSLVTVSVAFDTLDLHLPLLPVPSQVVGHGTARVENLPATPLGCGSQV